MNPHFLNRSGKTQDLEVETRTDSEADEFRSCIGKKAVQRRTRYAIERGTGIIPAWHNGRRTDESSVRLLEKLSVFSIKHYHTDEWKSYRGHIPSHKDVIGKADTWMIERKNLNFRTHIKRLSRKAICFSKNEKIHDNVIGMHISRYYFENGLYSESA